MSKGSNSKKSSVSSGSRSSSFSTFKEEEAIKEKMRFADLMTEVSCMKQKKLQELATEELKVKMEIERAKAGVNIMEGETQTFGEIANR